MAKYKVKIGFRDVHTKEDYSAGQEIEMTVKRANEAEKNLTQAVEDLKAKGKETEKYESGFLERVDKVDK